MRLACAISLLAATVACSSSPASPTPGPAPAPSPTTITGHVLAANGGSALAGVQVSVGSIAATTDATGTFTASAPAGAYPLSLTGAGIVPHRTSVLVQQPRDVNLTAIALDGQFDLDFYRMLIRDGFDRPTALQPIRRLTTTPRIYLKTVDEAGAPIATSTLDLIEQTIRDIIPHWTSGALGSPAVERGTDTREGISGWLTVKFPTTLLSESGFCGQASVGVDGGDIQLAYEGVAPNGAKCGTTAIPIPAHVIRHEVGHALGFYHTSTIGDLMYPGSYTSPTGFPSARELAHAAIAYARPIGNVDPDVDPTTTVNLAPARVIP